jgi:hypothetical protein
MASHNFEVTEQSLNDVKSMAALGIPEDDIGKVLGISAAKVRRLFRTELRREPIEANKQVMQALFDMAVSGKNATAAMFWAKARCGMQEKSGEQTAEPPVKRIVFLEKALVPKKSDRE